eukprot:SAG31_NODE_311_length_17866_cov_7.010750_2_plen_112_part_00
MLAVVDFRFNYWGVISNVILHMFNLNHFRYLHDSNHHLKIGWGLEVLHSLLPIYVASFAISFEPTIALTALTRTLKASIGTSPLEVIPLRFQPKACPTTSVASLREARDEI